MTVNWQKMSELTLPETTGEKIPVFIKKVDNTIRTVWFGPLVINGVNIFYIEEEFTGFNIVDIKKIESWAYIPTFKEC